MHAVVDVGSDLMRELSCFQRKLLMGPEQIHMNFEAGGPRQ